LNRTLITIFGGLLLIVTASIFAAQHTLGQLIPADAIVLSPSSVNLTSTPGVDPANLTIT